MDTIKLGKGGDRTRESGGKVDAQRLLMGYRVPVGLGPQASHSRCLAFAGNR